VTFITSDWMVDLHHKREMKLSSAHKNTEQKREKQKIYMKTLNWKKQ